MIIIPHTDLSKEALQTLIEEFATRNGTDYGASETGLSDKVKQIIRQLETKKVMIVFDPEMQSCNIIINQN